MSCVFQTVCILVAFVLSCHAKNCCYPDQFESTVKQVIGWADTTGRSSFATAKFSVSFDTLGQRIYIDEDIYVGNKKYSLVQLQLYKKGVQYNVLNNKTCSKVSLKPWTKQNCIPDNAVKLPPSTLGMKPYLKIQDYFWIKDGIIKTMTVTSETCVPVFDQYESFPGDNAVKLPPSTLGMKPYLKIQDYFWIKDGIIKTMTVTSETCVPVFDQYESFPGGKTMGVSKIENVTPGIKNPHVFDVLDICKHAQMIEEIATRRPMFPF